MRIKQLMLPITLALLLGVGFAAHAAQCSATLELEGMYCAMCSVTIKTALEFADGVYEAKVSRDPDEAVIHYDDARTSPAKLIEVVKKSGYGARIKPPRAKP